MTKKSLILGAVTLCALPAAALAQTLLSENFDELTPRTQFSGMIGQFTGTTVRINGNLNGPPVLHPLCTGALSGNCAQLNAVTGRLQSIEVTLEPGTPYSLSFALTGNPSSPTAMTNTTVTLGPTSDPTEFFNRAFPLSGSAGGLVTDRFMVPTSSMPTPVELIFRTTGPAGSGGPLLDNINLAGVPEPATLGLLALGLLGAGLSTRKRGN